MKLDKVMDEIAEAMKKLTGLRVASWPAASVSIPGGYVSYPQSVDYDQTYGRGVDTFTDLSIVLLAGDVTAKSARDQGARWAAGSGPESLKAALESYPWTTCDDVTVTQCEFDGETEGGAVYLAARFKATVMGPGED